MIMAQKTTSFEVFLKYLADDEQDEIRSSMGDNKSASADGFNMQSVLMHDGRNKRFFLEREGFELKKQSTNVKKFYDNNEIKSIYEDEIQELVRKATGAQRIEIFDHTYRSASESVQRKHGTRKPVATIHNDYNAESGPACVRKHFPDETDELLKNRFAIINVWRSINGTVENFPLAMCDSSTVSQNDLVSAQRVAKNRAGAVQLATYNPSHCWYYFPQLQTHEILLFKVFDTQRDKGTHFTLHTSFEDPTIIEDVADRQSIESRCFVFF